MNRFERRRAAAIARTTIRKKSAFGRIVVTDMDNCDDQHDRIYYRHTTKGRQSRNLRGAEKMLDDLLEVT